MDGEGNGSRLGVLSKVGEGAGLDASGVGVLGLAEGVWGAKLGAVDGRDNGDSELEGVAGLPDAGVFSGVAEGIGEGVVEGLGGLDLLDFGDLGNLG
jgi:hypothetical protein